MVKTRKQKAEAKEDEAEAEPEVVVEKKKKSKDKKEAAPAKKKSKGLLGGWLNMSTLATLAACAYVGVAFTNFSRLLDPLNNLPPDVWARSGRVKPLWPENSTLTVEVAISTLAVLSADVMRNASLYEQSTAIAWRATGLFGAEREAPRDRVDLPPMAWEALRTNGTLYLHSAITNEAAGGRWSGLADADHRRTARVPSIPLVKYEPEPTGSAAQKKRKLLGDVPPWLASLGPPAPWAPTYSGVPGAMCGKWKPEAAVRVVAEFREWPDALQMPGMQRLRERQPGGGSILKYAPPTYADEIGLTSDKYVLIVVLAYLVDQGASLLVSVPAFGAILIQAWKVEKATGVRLSWSSPYCLKCHRLDALAEAAADSGDAAGDADRETLRVDRLTTSYLGLVLAPLVLGYACKTLLALNYSLKSVSHLPWKLLCFRFVNTFIDDLFAFVIKMPMMHRVSCFRDDVVFVIYLYQRRIYKVDAARSTAMEDEAH
ncbi:apoptotic process [Aureococcus anophagefferens]|nr:apoptotic process [Aureococcus anophagefferens]